MAEDAFLVVFLLVYVLGFGVPAVITGMKGKTALFMVALFFFHPLWWVGAIMLARPESWWARQYYDDKKLAEAFRRYPPTKPLYWTWRRANPPPSVTRRR